LDYSEPSTVGIGIGIGIEKADTDPDTDPDTERGEGLFLCERVRHAAAFHPLLQWTFTIVIRAVLQSAVMNIRIYSNGTEAHLTHFIGKFLASVCFGIVSSLKTPRPIRKFRLDVEGEDVRLEVNGMPVPINMSKGFSRIIILDTVRGMIKHLKMADPEGAIRVDVDLDAVGFSFEMDRCEVSAKMESGIGIGPGGPGG
jgi:hypothetical protein